MADEDQGIASSRLMDVLGLLGAGGLAKGIVPPVAALRIPRVTARIPPSLSDEDKILLRESINRTPGAKLKPEGLFMDVKRFQDPKYQGKSALSGGVFYEPKHIEESPYSHDMLEGPWGGPQEIIGRTLFRNPLFVHGGGGSIGVHAGPKLFSERELEDLQKDVDFATGGSWVPNPRMSLIQAYREVYAPEAARLPEFTSNEARYYPWLMESAMANRARDRGHDSIITYGMHPHSENYEDPQLGEVFDLRERRQPLGSGKFYKSSLWPQYQQYLKD